LNKIKTISLLTLALFAGSASAAGNIFTNGTFDSSAFDTEYNKGASAYDASSVNIAASAHDLHGSWTDFPSEFGPTMLIVNGGTDATKAVWSQTVGLSAGSSYDFLLSAASTYGGSPSNLEVTVTYGANTVSLGTLQLGSSAGEWQTFTQSVSLGYTGNATFKLLDLNTDPSGNDFAVDKVSLTSAVPEPETYAMLMAGLGLVGFAARRRKAA
jgi:hypothetical protein